MLCRRAEKPCFSVCLLRNDVSAWGVGVFLQTPMADRQLLFVSQLLLWVLDCTMSPLCCRFGFTLECNSTRHKENSRWYAGTEQAMVLPQRYKSRAKSPALSPDFLAFRNGATAEGLGSRDPSLFCYITFLIEV